MALYYESPQPQSPLRNGQDAHFTHEFGVYPPNDLDRPFYAVHHGMSFVNSQTQWQPVAQLVPWPHPYHDLGPPRSYTIDSSDGSSADSFSARPSEEPRFETPYCRMNTIHSPYHAGQVYASPSLSHASLGGGTDCVGVIPRDLQQLPDPIAEASDHLDMGETIEVHPGSTVVYAASPGAMETGLHTPASETVSGPIGHEIGAQGEEESDADDRGGDNSGDYSPVARKSKIKKLKTSPKTTALVSPLRSRRNSRGHKVTKSSHKIKIEASTLASPPPSSKDVSPTRCTTCGKDHLDKNSLLRHIRSAHKRPFSCIFDIYGCTATFGAKNEWKRHCSTQHLRLSFYRCDLGSCVPTNATTSQRLPGWDMPHATPSAPGFNDFNRKDLFIQHHRRMHAPEGISGATPADRDRFKTICERAARRCQVSARKPPPRTICGFCQAKGSPVVFEGSSTWETRMEHVGRHLESAKGEHKMQWDEDIDLREWLIGEGLLQKTERGQWRLTDLIRADEVKSKQRS